MTGEERPPTWIYRTSKPILILGEIPARYPVISLIVLLLMTVVMGIGLSKLKTDDSLDQFLRSDSPDYQVFERMSERFPASDLDIYLAVEGDDLLGAKHLNQLRELNFDLLFADGVESITSIFSLRQPLPDEGTPAALIPDELPEDKDALAELQHDIETHPLAESRLISPDTNGTRLALLVVSLQHDEITKRGLPTVVDEVREIAQNSQAAKDLKIGLAGMPTMKAEVVSGTKKDISTFNGVGLLVGVVALGFYFRRVRLVVIALSPAVLAIVWCLGLFGWTGTMMNPLLNAVMPLVLVVTINNAMHFLFGLCRNLDEGMSKKPAIHRTIVEIGPACALTSLTTSIALFSLAMSNSALIQKFGIMAGMCILVSLLLVIAVMPVLAALFLKEGQAKYLVEEKANWGVKLLDSASAAVSALVLRWATPIAVGGTILTIVFAIAYFQLEPRYRLSDMLPDQGTASQVSKQIENRLGGLFPLRVVVDWPEDETAQSPDVRQVIAQVHGIMDGHPKIGKVNSLNDLQQWAESSGLSPDDASARLMEMMPPEVASRYVNRERHAALVSGYIGDLEAKEILQIREDLEPQLAEVQAANPGFQLSLTGIASVGATRSTAIISQLSYSMLGAIAIVIAVIGLAFWSLLYAGLATIPNLFALFATATWLAFLQGGLDYATIVGLTVAFGLAVDHAIHVLNRFELEMERSESVAVAVDRTLRLIGTVLILTTAVLVAGLSITQLSAVPPTRQFGLICLSTLIFALLADLIILPALILVTSRYRMGRRLLSPEPEEGWANTRKPQER
ncbi:efflux RND transporter permease subunit [Methyloligella solikamskensis]|uniref:RND family transporter n=1 Tax=Methyloligella solikamskensis TaxID=1177756 RepID=A0ABW3J7X5_9HYPH